MFTPILRLAREETQKDVKGNPPADQSVKVWAETETEGQSERVHIQ